MSDNTNTAPPEEVPLGKFRVVKGFTLLHDNGTKEYFAPGDYERPPAIAQHWWVMAHTDNPPPVALAVGTPQHANMLRLAVEARRKLLAEAEAAYEAALTEGQKVFNYTEAAPVLTAPSGAIQAEGKGSADASSSDGAQIEGAGSDAAGIVARRKIPPQE